MEKNATAKAKSWPFEEARKVLCRLEQHPKTHVTFAMGYGASGLPHIGTFGEAVRTAMIQRAFSVISDIPSSLLCISDDMDGLRKVPENIPNPNAMRSFLHHPLTSVPDPFGQYESFGAQNNARFRAFLDSFGFAYTFLSSTDYYRSGKFDAGLLNVLAHHAEILDVMLPTLREERRQTYSPFLPISPRSGRVLQVPIEEYRVEQGTLVFRDEGGERTELPVTGGNCKLQWKVDWGMRWTVLDVDYEMAGKDLIDSVTLSSKICRILGGTPPEGMITEHFLDELGQKISKSKGNGISLEEWLTYAPTESLAYYMFQSPKRAKRLYFDVIPKNVDDYFTQLETFSQQSPQQQWDNPVWFVHTETTPVQTIPISFSMLLNLATVCKAEDPEILWGFIGRYAPQVTPQTHPALGELVTHAVQYYKDIMAPKIQHRAPTPLEREALMALDQALSDYEGMSHGTEPVDPDALQTLVYTIGKQFAFASLKDWFSCLYEVLLGQPSGPRLGSFIALYGIPEIRALIQTSLLR